jgi:hypothetical protein
VPVAPVVTAAVKVIAVLRFSGERGAALTEIVEAVNAGEAREAVPAGPVPPLLKATTENV